MLDAIATPGDQPSQDLPTDLASPSEDGRASPPDAWTSSAVLADDLRRRVFAFRRIDGADIATLTLRANGTIAGSYSDNERTWSVEDGTLIFRDGGAVATTVFNEVRRQDGLLAFRGAHVVQGPGPWHTLSELRMSSRRDIVTELVSEIYGGDRPTSHADARFRDDGYAHTNLVHDVVTSVFDVVEPSFWLEIGSMLGGSAIRVADVVKARAADTKIVCIDPFTGDVNMWAWEEPKRQAGEWLFLGLKHGRPTIYDRFLANVAAAGHDDVILPIATTSTVGMKLLTRLVREGRVSSLPDVIYLDSAHEPNETFLELLNAWQLLAPGGVLMGDDWSWEAVRTDVLRFAAMVAPDPGRRRDLAAHHRHFSEQDGVLLDRGQWVLVK